MFGGWDIAVLAVAPLTAAYVLGVWSEWLLEQWRHRH